jgi:hypothetical protein
VNNSFAARGAAGVVRWSYHTAASLGPWTMALGPEGITLTASVLSSDAFKVSQQPLTFMVVRPNGVTWRWPIQSLQIDSGSLTASLGPQE